MSNVTEAQVAGVAPHGVAHDPYAKPAPIPWTALSEHEKWGFEDQVHRGEFLTPAEVANTLNDCDSCGGEGKTYDNPSPLSARPRVRDCSECVPLKVFIRRLAQEKMEGCRCWHGNVIVDDADKHYWSPCPNCSEARTLLEVLS